MRHSSFCRRYRSRRCSTSRPLRCESLEDRRLLTITVDTLVDEADGSIDDRDISLRDAIAVGETIDFDASLDAGEILLTMRELSITKAMTIDATALPAYETVSNGSVRWLVWCDHCGTHHHHGPAEGHREAYCNDPASPYWKTGYNLAFAGTWSEHTR